MAAKTGGKKTRTVVVTVGNEFRGDDAAGIVFGRSVAGRIDSPVIEAGDAPENACSEIVRHDPDCIVIVDAMDFGGEPGGFVYTAYSGLDNLSISTHGSLNLFAMYLEKATSADIRILGIQPKSLDMEAAMSEEVLRAIDAIAGRVAAAGGFDGVFGDDHTSVRRKAVSGS
ncbi:MAG: hydrogenase maturation protease [Candidatus Latescibacteria bacterium]|nr:hydrogenase maturation protease [Candidatus Latescibacterota bacterium]